MHVNSREQGTTGHDGKPRDTRTVTQTVTRSGAKWRQERRRRIPSSSRRNHPSGDSGAGATAFRVAFWRGPAVCGGWCALEVHRPPGAGLARDERRYPGGGGIRILIPRGSPPGRGRSASELESWIGPSDVSLASPQRLRDALPCHSERFPPLLRLSGLLSEATPSIEPLGVCFG